MEEHDLTSDISRLLIHASTNEWCWKIPCTTCGNLKLRSALLAIGNLPSDLNEIQLIDFRSNHAKAFTLEQLNAFQSIKLSAFAHELAFPSWLGIFGVAMTLTPPAKRAFYPNWMIFDPIRHFLHETDCRGVTEVITYLAEKNWDISYEDLGKVEAVILDSYGNHPDFKNPPLWYAYEDAVNPDLLRGAEYDRTPYQTDDFDEDFSYTREAQAAKYRRKFDTTGHR